jgi:hypothetical protein
MEEYVATRRNEKTTTIMLGSKDGEPKRTIVTTASEGLFFAIDSCVVTGPCCHSRGGGNPERKADAYTGYAMETHTG